MTVYAFHPAPIGPLVLVGELDSSSGFRLTGIYLPEHRHGRRIEPSWVADPPAFRDVTRQLDEYFDGTRTSFALPLAPAGTAFQHRVWDELARIPLGTIVTYGELADRCGHPGAARAVGSAVGRNPLSIVVPCHRVVGTGGALTGYAGGLARKAFLLALEGVPVATPR